MKAIRLLTVAVLSTLVILSSVSAEDQMEADEDVRIVVLLPEQIDTEWFWYYYTEVSQHLVQGAVEKAFIRAGYDVIDLQSADIFSEDGDISKVATKAFALPKAAELGATHVIIGRATAARMSHDVAYGVDVYRSSAEIMAKLVRVSDGKILAVEDASATSGGQSQKTSGQDALKEAGKDVASKLVRAAKRKLGGE